MNIGESGSMANWQQRVGEWRNDSGEMAMASGEMAAYSGDLAWQFGGVAKWPTTTKSSSYRESRSPSVGLTTKIALSSVTLTSVILNGKQRQGKVSSTKPSLPLLKTTYSHRWWMSPGGWVHKEGQHTGLGLCYRHVSLHQLLSGWRPREKRPPIHLDQPEMSCSENQLKSKKNLPLLQGRLRRNEQRTSWDWLQ